MIKIKRFYLLAALVLAVATEPRLVLAQAPGASVARVSAKASSVAVAPGGHSQLIIKIALQPGFHINANKPNDPDLIPTVFTGTGASVTFEPPRYPIANSGAVSYEAKPMLVYTGQFVITVPFTVSKTAKAGQRITLSGALNYQGCNATSCFPPSSAPVTASIKVK